MTVNSAVIKSKFYNRRDLRRHVEYAVADDCQIDCKREITTFTPNIKEAQINFGLRLSCVLDLEFTAAKFPVSAAHRLLQVVFQTPVNQLRPIFADVPERV